MTTSAPAQRPEASAWTVGPLRPHLAEGILEVWHADLDTAGDAVLRSLAGDEIARAARFPGAMRGRRWARARAVLRTLLGAYLGEDPRALRLEAGAAGKPRLADHAGHRIGFNVSHSGPHALFAFARAGDVGVDIERARPAADRLSLAARAFGPLTARRLHALDAQAREREFLTMWVRREALLKCLGRGIWEGPRSDAGSGDAGSEWADASGPSSPWITDVTLGRGMAGAVASARPPSRVRWCEWRAERHSHLARADLQLAAAS